MPRLLDADLLSWQTNSMNTQITNNIIIIRTDTNFSENDTIPCIYTIFICIANVHQTAFHVAIICTYTTNQQLCFYAFSATCVP